MGNRIVKYVFFSTSEKDFVYRVGKNKGSLGHPTSFVPQTRTVTRILNVDQRITVGHLKVSILKIKKFFVRQSLNSSLDA